MISEKNLQNTKAGDSIWLVDKGTMGVTQWDVLKFIDGSESLELTDFLELIYPSTGCTLLIEAGSEYIFESESGALTFVAEKMKGSLTKVEQEIALLIEKRQKPMQKFLNGLLERLVDLDGGANTEKVKPIEVTDNGDDSIKEPAIKPKTAKKSTQPVKLTRGVDYIAELTTEIFERLANREIKPPILSSLNDTYGHTNSAKAAKKAALKLASAAGIIYPNPAKGYILISK